MSLPVRQINLAVGRRHWPFSNLRLRPVAHPNRSYPNRTRLVEPHWTSFRLSGVIGVDAAKAAASERRTHRDYAGEEVIHRMRYFFVALAMRDEKKPE